MVSADAGAYTYTYDGDGLIYRETFTADAVRAIQDHLVHDCGRAPDLTTAPDVGKIAFV